MLCWLFILSNHLIGFLWLDLWSLLNLDRGRCRYLMTYNRLCRLNNLSFVSWNTLYWWWMCLNWCLIKISFYNLKWLIDNLRSCSLGCWLINPLSNNATNLILLIIILWLILTLSLLILLPRGFLIVVYNLLSLWLWTKLL
jgi:hypothetical protein